MMDFRPISLCNTFYKILTKILIGRIKPLLDKIISNTQKGFVPGRQILDAAITTHEIIHSMDKCRAPGMAFKLDISKAYDKVNWSFLLKILGKLGFNEKVIQIIKECTQTVSFSILTNGSPGRHFTPEKGLRQGDPLSPYLFIMVADVLSRTMSMLVTTRKIQGFKPTSTHPQVVLEQFVDDTFLFGYSSVIEARQWKQTLDWYAWASGQCINYQKSRLFFFNTPVDVQNKVLKILGCLIAMLPSTYLGLPLTVKEVSLEFWNSILERTQRKLAGWKGKLLSNAGNLQLVASTLQGIPVYFQHC
jgi:hypothetical protein